MAEFLKFNDAPAKESARLGGAAPGLTNPPQPLPPASTLHVFTGRANTAAVTGESGAGATGVAGVSHGAGSVGLYGQAGGGGMAGLFQGDLHVRGGAIVPYAGNGPGAGIQFPSNPGGGGGDEAFIRYYAAPGTESTRLVVGINNDADDALGLWQANAERLTISSGFVGINNTNPNHVFHVKADSAVGLFESTSNQAYVRVSTNEGLDKRIELANRPGGRLAFWLPASGDAFNILQDGRVGIGTTAPAYRLDVAGDIIVRGRIGAGGQLPTPRTGGWGGGIHTWDLEVEASAWCRGGWQTGHRDLAETYACAESLEPGDVVCTGSEPMSIVPSDSANATSALGVVSANPGFLLGASEPGPLPDQHYPVTLCGHVRCRVVDEGGPIRPGDLLTTSSTRGHAMRATPIDLPAGETVHRPGTIIGKALSTLESGAGVVDALVTMM